MKPLLKRIDSLKDGLYQFYARSLSNEELVEKYLELETRRREAFELPPLTPEQIDRMRESARSSAS